MERDRLKTAICANFGIDVPIFGFAHSVAAAAAISREGGLGVYGATRGTPGEIRERLAQMRALAGDRPIGVDLVLPHGMPERDDREAIEAALGPVRNQLLRFIRSEAGSCSSTHHGTRFG